MSLRCPYKAEQSSDFPQMRLVWGQLEFHLAWSAAAQSIDEVQQQDACGLKGLRMRLIYSGTDDCYVVGRN